MRGQSSFYVDCDGFSAAADAPHRGVEMFLEDQMQLPKNCVEAKGTNSMMIGQSRNKCNEVEVSLAGVVVSSEKRHVKLAVQLVQIAQKIDFGSGTNLTTFPMRHLGFGKLYFHSFIFDKYCNLLICFE